MSLNTFSPLFEIVPITVVVANVLCRMDLLLFVMLFIVGE